MSIHETMERIVPELIPAHDAPAQLSLQLHLERYRFACEHLLPGRVLDIACGTGYGTRLLAECSTEVCTGVDVSAEAIAYAQANYAHARTQFFREELIRFDDAEQFANIVSLETIEHITHPDKVVAHLHSLLLPGGHLIVSAPVTPSVDANPYHVNDFTERSFRKLFTGKGFTEIASLKQNQPYSLREVAGKKTAKANHVRKGLVQFYLSHPGKLLLRLKSLVMDGFNNRYLVLVMRKES
jgi:SAM-dependent methyltransferase